MKLKTDNRELVWNRISAVYYSLKLENGAVTIVNFINFTEVDKINFLGTIYEESWARKHSTITESLGSLDTDELATDNSALNKIREYVKENFSICRLRVKGKGVGGFTKSFRSPFSGKFWLFF